MYTGDGLKSLSMVSETTSSIVEEEASGGRCTPCRKSLVKIPKRIHKAEREKLKREHLNELFQDLANALELNQQQQNNGKASVLCEAAKWLKEITGQIDSLKKENTSLSSESQYVTVENKELKEENSTLQAQVVTLQNEVKARVVESKPDLNVPPPLPTEYEEPELSKDSFGISHAEQQRPTVLIVPIINPNELTTMPYPLQASSNVSKPHARYPTPSDSWPVQLLGEQVMQRKEAHW